MVVASGYFSSVPDHLTTVDYVRIPSAKPKKKIGTVAEFVVSTTPRVSPLREIYKHSINFDIYIVFKFSVMLIKWILKNVDNERESTLL